MCVRVQTHACAYMCTVDGNAQLPGEGIQWPPTSSLSALMLWAPAWLMQKSESPRDPSLLLLGLGLQISGETAGLKHGRCNPESSLLDYGASTDP